MDELNPPASPVVIIGGGPAGMGCALWLKQMGCHPVLIEQQPQLGGQLLHIERINRWVLGKPERTSVELARDYAAHLRAEDIEIRLGTRVVRVASPGAPWDLIVATPAGRGTTIRCSHLVIATGTRMRTHEAFGTVPGFEATRAAGRISFWPLDHLGRLADLRHQRVAVIGGGDNAHCTAADLADVAGRVHLLRRSAPTVQRPIRARVAASIASGRIVEHAGVAISRFTPGPGSVRIAAAGGTDRISIDVDMIFARVGFIPNTEFLSDLGPLAQLRQDARGHLRVDAGKRTSLHGVYAIGDVANPDDQAVVLSIADGALAARSIVRDLVARHE